MRISAVSAENESDFLGLVCDYPLFGTAMLCNYATYSADSRFAQYWVVYDDDQPIWAAELYKGIITVCCERGYSCPDTFGELLCLVPGWDRLLAYESFAAAVAVPQGYKKETGSIMLLRESGAVPYALPRGMELSFTPELKPLYSLLCETNDEFRRKVEFDFWYTDISYRLRHNTARLACVKADGIYIASADAVFVAGGALISNVCVLPKYRNMGVATALVSQLAECLTQEALRARGLYCGGQMVVYF